MSEPTYHGWTHAPKEQGGTDPIPLQDPAIIAYAYISQILDQEDPFPSGGQGNNPSLFGPMSEGFTSDETILYPHLASGAIHLYAEGSGGDAGDSSPGLYVASCTVGGWDAWSGSNLTVHNAVKGAGVFWDCATIDGRGLVLPLDPPSLVPHEQDFESNCTDMNIVQAAALNQVQPWMAQFSGIDALITQISLFVCLVKPYLFIPEGFGTPSTSVGTRTPDFGKWYTP